MAGKIFLSIVMVCYNQGRYLREAIGSVLAQSYRSWELIIVDDGSGDDSVSIAGSYVSAYPDKIKLLRHAAGENRGISASYLLGLEHARGDFVGFLEGDDLWHPDNAEIKVGVLRENKAGLVYSAVEPMDDGISFDKRRLYLGRTVKLPRLVPFSAAMRMLFYNFIPSFSSVFVRRDLLRDIRGINDRISEVWLDWFFWVQISMRTKFIFIPKELVRWRWYIHSYSDKFIRNRCIAGKILFELRFRLMILREIFINAEIRGRGIFYWLKEGLIRAIRIIFFCPIGLVAFPFCSVFNIKFLNVFVLRLGHLCLEPDCYIKEGILGKHPKYKAVILASVRTVANRHLLSYWGKYFTIIRSPAACMFLRPLSENPFTVFNVYRYCSSVNRSADYPSIQDAYQKLRGRPVMVLEKTDHDRGWDLLQKLGVPRGSWFVCIHCREEGYISREGQTYRNADIGNYLPAMAAVAERGGWVIRLGDASMKAVSLNKNFIDYAHLDIKSDWMDVFLSAQCRFFLGSASGLYLLANIFGVPAGCANNAPASTVLTYAPYNVGIPMLMRRKGEERYISFKDVFNSPAADFRYDYLYSDAGIEAEQNTSDDIRGLAIEMLDRFEGRLEYSREDDRLQARFKSLLKPCHYSYGAVSRVGKDFLRKYESLL